jgi:hypothetical protein
MSVYALSASSTLDPSEVRIEELDGSLGPARLPSLAHTFHVTAAQMRALFFDSYDLGYLVEYFASRQLPLRVVTHPVETNTCFEKAELLGADWSPLDVIKAVYLRDSDNGNVHAFAVPETGCFLDRDRLRNLLGGPSSVGPLAVSEVLPRNMVLGTCSPFVTDADARSTDVVLSAIVFDSETLMEKKHDRTLDDFSFGLDRRFSLQMSYFHAYKVLKHHYPSLVQSEEIMGVTCTERLVRSRGRLKINYDIESLSYRIAKRLDEISRSVSLSSSNDHIDEVGLERRSIAPAE